MPTRLILIPFLVFSLLLGACSATPTSPEPTAASAAPATSTPAPTTAGPTPTLPPPLVILLLPVDLSAEQSNAYQSAVYDLAQSAGYRFQVRNRLTVEELAQEPTLKVVVALPPDPGIAALAAAAPQAQFLAINIPEVQVGGNVSALDNASLRVDYIAFMAGYIAGMVSEDHRSGVLVKDGSPNANSIITAYRTGQEYFCGLCNPFSGPFEDYPLAQSIPQDAKPVEYSAYADILLRRGVEVLFAESGLQSDELLQYLPTVGVLMIGTETPLKSVSGWVVTLQPNYIQALQAAFPALLAGQGGKVFPAPLSLTDANPDLFSPGKQENALRVLQELSAGYIFSGVNP